MPLALGSVLQGPGRNGVGAVVRVSQRCPRGPAVFCGFPARRWAPLADLQEQAGSLVCSFTRQYSLNS